MPRYVALLRGVSPQNASSAALQAAFDRAGFSNVTTVLSSGNVVFNTRMRSEAAIQSKAEEALQAELGRGFLTVLRSQAALQALIASDPFGRFTLPAAAKRVISFLRQPQAARVPLPLVAEHAQVLALNGCECLTVYVPGQRDPVFMRLIERALGTEVTTRTWDSVCRCASA